MGKKYTYHGYTYFATNNLIYTDVRRFNKVRKEWRPVYHIEGLKDASAKPFLTSLRQCINYIDYHEYIKRTNRNEERNEESDEA